MRFVCWLWRGRGFWKRTVPYDAGHVAVLTSMLRRHGGHSLTCVHDGSFELPAGVDGIRMPDSVAALPDYLPKVWAWSPELHRIIGERFASIDLDVVLLRDVAPELGGPEPVRLWDQAKGEPYNTSLFALNPGFGYEVWGRMTPDRAADARAAAQRWTGDQSWVAHVMGPHLPTFGTRSGIIRYRPGMHRDAPPADARAMFFCGPFCPKTESEHAPWIRDHYR